MGRCIKYTGRIFNGARLSAILLPKTFLKGQGYAKMAIDVNQLRKGTTYTEDGEIYRVVNYSHNKSGRGGATIRVTVRNMRSGAQIERTYNSGNRVEDIRVEAAEVEFLYDDGAFLTFMDTETYEQPQMNRDIFGEDVTYLKPNLIIKLLKYGEEIIDYELPITLHYEEIEKT